MDALLGRLVVGDLRFVCELEVFYKYTVVAVDRILIDPRHWYIVTVGNADALYMKVLLLSDAFTEEDELKICAGLTLVYTGLQRRWK